MKLEAVWFSVHTKLPGRADKLGMVRVGAPGVLSSVAELELVETEYGPVIHCKAHNGEVHLYPFQNCAVKPAVREEKKDAKRSTAA